MACVCSRYHTQADWLIEGYYSPIMPTGRLQAYKTKEKVVQKIISFFFSEKMSDEEHSA